MHFSPWLTHYLVAGQPRRLDSRQSSPTPTTCSPGTLRDRSGQTLGCGSKGHLQTIDLRQSSKVSALASCANECFLDNYCVSFGFSKAQSTCQLYGSTLSQMGYVNSSTGIFKYYSRSCFETTCPNILDNGDFEQGSWFPWTVRNSTFTASYEISSPGANGSNYAGSLSVGQGPAESITMAQLVNNLVIGQQYVWSFDFKLGDETCGAQFGDTYATTFNGNVRERYLTLGSENTTIGIWNHYTAYITAQSENITLTAMVTCNLAGNTTEVVGEYDNFVMSPFATSIYTSNSPKIGPNLVTNPSFESASLKSYNFTNSLRSSIALSQPGYGGSKQAANVTMAPRAFPPTFLLFQTIPLQTGRTYVLSYEYKAAVPVSGVFTGVLSFMSAPYRDYYAYGQGVAYVIPPTLPTNWTFLWNTFTAQRDLLDLSFEVIGTNNTFSIDDIQLYELA